MEVLDTFFTSWEIVCINSLTYITHEILKRFEMVQTSNVGYKTAQVYRLDLVMIRLYVNILKRSFIHKMLSKIHYFIDKKYSATVNTTRIHVFNNHYATYIII